MPDTSVRKEGEILRWYLLWHLDELRAGDRSEHGHHLRRQGRVAIGPKGHLRYRPARPDDRARNAGHPALDEGAQVLVVGPQRSDHFCFGRDNIVPRSGLKVPTVRTEGSLVTSACRLWIVCRPITIGLTPRQPETCQATILWCGGPPRVARRLQLSKESNLPRARRRNIRQRSVRLQYGRGDGFSLLYRPCCNLLDPASHACAGRGRVWPGWPSARIAGARSDRVR